MKKLTIAVSIAAAVLALPSSTLADPGNAKPKAKGQPNHGQVVSAVAKHKFRKGEKFNRSLASDFARLDYRNHRGLHAPPPGQYWVRSGTDAILVRATDEVVMSVLDSIF